MIRWSTNFDPLTIDVFGVDVILVGDVELISEKATKLQTKITNALFTILSWCRAQNESCGSLSCFLFLRAGMAMSTLIVLF